MGTWLEKIESVVSCAVECWFQIMFPTCGETKVWHGIERFDNDKPPWFVLRDYARLCVQVSDALFWQVLFKNAGNSFDQVTITFSWKTIDRGDIVL